MIWRQTIRCLLKKSLVSGFHQLEWVNFGGGHHITREGYNLSLLEDCIKRVQKKYDVEVYLEPGEAIALNAGFL